MNELRLWGIRFEAITMAVERPPSHRDRSRKMNLKSLVVLLIAPGILACSRTPHGSASVPREATAADVSAIKAELERLYEQNAAAFSRGDVAAVMALRAPDFHTITPDGAVRDRAAMERYTQGFINGIRKWNAQTITIDSLRVSGDTAFAVVTQHLDRMALRPDNQVHHVETWVTQRETWVRYGSRWLMWRVDQLRYQRRLIDGRPG
jgi:ketosteroid isomerase-like protein